MPPIVKENENLIARPETVQRPSTVPALPGDSAVKQQPVALEVPVTINGARTVEGSDKREPFSESTKTVLIFGTGAVIRLASSVTSGQLLFLTNEKTKKEVVCQVVKSKNYRNVSGYVELEFTESVVGFWGMRFPGDRIVPVTRPAAPAPLSVSSTVASGLPVASRPVAPSPVAPAVNVASSIVPPKPAVPASPTRDAGPKLSQTRVVTPAPPAAQIPSAPPAQELLAQKPVAPVAPLSSALSSSFDPTVPLKLPSESPVVPAVPVASFMPVSAAPEFKVNVAPEKLAAPPSSLFDAPRPSEMQASFLEPAKTPAVPLTPTVPNPNSFFEAKPADPGTEPPAVQVFADPETETLKKHTARLQDQLSSLLFSEAHPASSLVATQNADIKPVLESKETLVTAPKVLDIYKASEPAHVPAKPIEPVKSVKAPAISSLDDEELKIPAWLEPLARNGAAPSSTQELIEREKAKRLSEQPLVEEFAAEPGVAVNEYQVPELRLPTFGSALPMDEEPSVEENGSRRSGSGTWIAAVAAGILLLAAGGWWYIQQQPDGAHAGAASNVQASVASLPVTSSPSQSSGNVVSQTSTPAQSNPAPLSNTPAKSNSAPNTLSVVPAAASAAPVRNPQFSANPERVGTSLTASASAQPVAVPQKKPILGSVHLATPKLSPRRNAQNGGEADAGITLTNDDQPEPNTDTLNVGLAGSNKQPVAPAVPLPVGGDVVQAKLISSMPSAYPPLAKSQHVSGNVLVDALIDASGRVTTMKVVSGPALLHQAAMDALKQWKYRPATLDGKPTPMHLTVTIQFRLQ